MLLYCHSNIFVIKYSKFNLESFDETNLSILKKHLMKEIEVGRRCPWALHLGPCATTFYLQCFIYYLYLIFYANFKQVFILCTFSLILFGYNLVSVLCSFFSFQKRNIYILCLKTWYSHVIDPQSSENQSNKVLSTLKQRRWTRLN